MGVNFGGLGFRKRAPRNSMEVTGQRGAILPEWMVFFPQTAYPPGLLLPGALLKLLWYFLFSRGVTACWAGLVTWKIGLL